MSLFSFSSFLPHFSFSEQFWWRMWIGFRCFHNLTRTVLLEMSRLIAFKATAAIFDDPTESSLSSSERRIAANDETTVTTIASSSAVAAPLQLSRHDVQQMGLDASREGKLVEELSQIYFNADVRVQQGGLLGAWIQSLVCCSNHTICCHLCS
jgi:hypothetical protein